MFFILGATGSIGASALDVISSNKQSVFALVANKNWKKMLELVVTFQPKYVMMCNENAHLLLQKKLEKNSKTRCLFGKQALCDLIHHHDVQTIICAISGCQGLFSTYHAMRSGKRVLLANKESLVMSGSLMMQTAKQNKTTVIPIDSEHHALWQCAFAHDAAYQKNITHVVLTASGGGVRHVALEQLSRITPEQACRHPNWSMGDKITIDSATLFNKVLEVLEAFYLFNVDKETLDIWIHPQSVVHGLVGWSSGSYVTSMSQPDMSVTIASALDWPQICTSGVALPSMQQLNTLSFSPVDYERYPVVKLLKGLLASTASEPIIANYANELAVHAFLSKVIGFTDISKIIEDALNSIVPERTENIDEIFQVQHSIEKPIKQLIKKYMI